MIRTFDGQTIPIYCDNGGAHNPASIDLLKDYWLLNVGSWNGQAVIEAITRADVDNRPGRLIVPLYDLFEHVN